MTSSAIWVSAALSPGKRRLRATSRWMSRNVGMRRNPVWLRQNGGSAVGLLDQRLQRRNIGIPFYQCRQRPESLHGFAEQLPRCRIDPRAMIVDEDDGAVAQGLHGMAGQMQLFDVGWRQSVQISLHVPAVIGGIDEDVVDVAQDAAAG